MREIDQLLKRRPDLGTLVGETEALRAQLAKERRSGVPGASALTTADLRVLPLLATHLSFPEIAAELFLSPLTIKSQVKLDLPQAGRLLAESGGDAGPGAGAGGGVTTGLYPHRRDGTGPVRGGMVLDDVGPPRPVTSTSTAGSPSAAGKEDGTEERDPG